MKTAFDQARQVMGHATQRWPLLTSTLALVLTVSVYLAGIFAVDALVGEARLPVIFFVVFFLPAVLRSWLVLYWRLREEWRQVRQRHRDAGAH